MFAFILRKVSVHISTLYHNGVMCVSTVSVGIRAMSLGKGPNSVSYLYNILLVKSCHSALGC